MRHRHTATKGWLVRGINGANVPSDKGRKRVQKCSVQRAACRRAEGSAPESVGCIQTERLARLDRDLRDWGLRCSMPAMLHRQRQRQRQRQHRRQRVKNDSPVRGARLSHESTVKRRPPAKVNRPQGEVTPSRKRLDRRWIAGSLGQLAPRTSHLAPDLRRYSRHHDEHRNARPHRAASWEMR